ncbi:winged helix-turn-helix domain-containing protein [Aliikangiella sp. IMCC44359]|uniref:winged helix-turn-helix domain-containing protein n=1 Tax=Aliikangiella sp. IMCC44359 TaxID=3459125 RepID=UPI00403A8BAC
MEPYVLNQWLINPKLCELVDESEKLKLQLEPQLMALLCFLVENKDKVVSRDELASAVWANVAIEDNTISKAITRLRKVLKDSARQPTFIKTIPKRGYLLVANVSLAIDSLTDQKNSEISKGRNFYPYIFYIISALVIIGVVVDYLTKTESSKDKAYDSMPITSMTGQEYHASFSSNTKDLVFIAFHKDLPWLFLKKQSDTLPKPMLELNDSQAVLQWSPVNNSILYAEQTNDLCQVILIEDVMASPLNRRLVFECKQEKKLNPAWDIDGKGFYYINTNNDSDIAKAYYYDLDKQEKKLVQQPEFNSDISYVSISKNGKYIGFLQNNHTNSSNVVILEKNSQERVANINLDYLISDFDWNNESTAIVHVSEHPSHRIIEHFFDGETRSIATSQMGYLQDVKAIGNSQNFVVTSRYIDRDLILIADRQSRKKIDSAYPDYNGIYSNQGDVLAFASKRSGRAQIWLAKKDGQVEQLSDFKQAFYIYDISWSKNDKLLLVRTSDLVIIFDIENQQVQNLNIKQDEPKSFSWLDNYHIIYVAHSTKETAEANTSLYSMNISNGQSQQLREHVNNAYYDLVEKQWYFSLKDGNEIYKTSDINIQGEVIYQAKPETRLVDWKYRYATLGVVEKKLDKPLEELFLLNDNKQSSIIKRRRIGYFDIVSANQVLLTQITSNESNIVKLIAQ